MPPLRKRVRGETREDYSKQSEMQRPVRQRLESAAGPFTIDAASRLIAQTMPIGLALKPPTGYMPKRNAMTSTLAELTERLRVFCRGVDPRLVGLYRDPLARTRFEVEGATHWAILGLGEVMDARYNLLGSLHQGKIVVKLRSTNKPRAHWVMLAAGIERPPKTTADHINYTMPLNDSVGDVPNLRWATAAEQTLNRRPRTTVSYSTETYRCIDATTGAQVGDDIHGMRQVAARHGSSRSRLRMLIRSGKPWQGKRFVCVQAEPAGTQLVHPTLSQRFQCTSAGWYRTRPKSNNIWGVWRWPAGPRPVVHIDGGANQLARLMVECVLGRLLRPGEQVDHIDGDPSNYDISNLQAVSVRVNMQKREVKPVAAVKDGHATVFFSGKLAAERLGIRRGHISSCMAGGLKHTGGYVFRDASVEEIRAMWM
jgi:hypothetical protein